MPQNAVHWECHYPVCINVGHLEIPKKKAVFLNTPYLNRFSFLSHTLVDGVSVVSRFVISPVLEQDAGEIACEAANRFGRDQKHFFVSIEGINLGLIEYGMYFCLNWETFHWRCICRFFQATQIHFRRSRSPFRHPFDRSLLSINWDRLGRTTWWKLTNTQLCHRIQQSAR